MRYRTRFALTVLIACLCSFFHTTALGQTSNPIPNPCRDGVLPSGALSRICVPPQNWNGGLVIWAHGYTAFNKPLDFQDLTLSDGTYLPTLVMGQGFAFATTSYRQNGLAILEGADDIRELVAAFPDVAGRAPLRTLLTGASEGGIITTLLAEQSPELFNGALAACGPIGNFKWQIDYWGDFRVLFDYFFPGVIPGSPISIPQEVIDNWETKYISRITAALASNPNKARQLISTSKAPVDPSRPETIVRTTINLLWYNVFATNDAIQKLGGNPYGNTGRWYWGSDNDLLLNLRVKRFREDRAAVNNIPPYQTSGRLRIPLITMHTTSDEVIPYWHELLYLGKVRTEGNGKLLPIPIFRYGHCNFTTPELLFAFNLLIQQAATQQGIVVER